MIEIVHSSFAYHYYSSQSTICIIENTPESKGIP